MADRLKPVHQGPRRNTLSSGPLINGQQVMNALHGMISDVKCSERNQSTNRSGRRKGVDEFVAAHRDAPPS
jgi:hypothetical protein